MREYIVHLSELPVHGRCAYTHSTVFAASRYLIDRLSNIISVSWVPRSDADADAVVLQVCCVVLVGVQMRNPDPNANTI